MRLKQSLNVTDQKLQDAWTRSAAGGDGRFKQELAGLADGSGVPLSLLQAAHAIPLLMPYLCSSVAAWGKATEDGHLYQTRNLDWKLGVGLHDFPVVVVYLPDRGIAHVVPTFAGVIGAHTGMNARGIVLAEMGDSPAREAPYDLDAPHFMVFFRSLLYDADSLSRTIEMFKGLRHTKRYHYVFGDGQVEHRAVKIRAHSPESPDRRIIIWKDNDPQDEVAPRILEQVVYNEGRGCFPCAARLRVIERRQDDPHCQPDSDSRRQRRQRGLRRHRPAAMGFLCQGRPGSLPASVRAHRSQGLRKPTREESPDLQPIHLGK